jgi:DUF971 family protein
MMASVRPLTITADRNQRVLIITWGDQHESRYPFDGLRAICPCVECRGGHSHMGGPPDPRVVRDTPESELSLEDVHAVGAYAIQLSWSDGHSTGIYSWEFLRAACPCEICLID